MQEISKEMIINLHWSMFFSFLAGASFSIMACFLFSPSPQKKKNKKKKNKCDCTDVYQCEKWCIAKINYTKNQKS